MFKNLLCIFIVLVLIANTSSSQITNYNFRATTGGSAAYVPITGTSVTLTGSCSTSTDEGYANDIPLGFTFKFNGVTYTNINVSTDGTASFGTGYTTGTQAAPGTGCNYENSNGLSSLVGSRPILAPFWDDLDVVGGVSYSTTGFAPLRVFTLQYSNAKWDYNATGGVLSFQIKLYESSNIVEFIYRQETAAVSNSSSGATIGIAGVGTGNGNFLSLGSSIANPTISSTLEIDTISKKPATGQIYAFDPVYCAAGGAYTGAGGEKISNVLFGTINNSSTSNAQYENFTNVLTVVQPGTTENLSITLSNSYSGDKVFVSIDYNADGDFSDAGELVYSSPASAGPFLNIPIAIPSTATIGITRMRLRLDDSGGTIYLGANPCGTADWGQVEDYSVNIQNCTLSAFIVQPVDTKGCLGSNVTISSVAAGTAINYQWQVSTDNGVTFTKLTNVAPYSNVTTSSLNITGITAAMNNYKFRDSLGGTCTLPGVYSNVVTLTVNTPAAVTAPVNAVVCAGGNASFTVTATGSSPAYQWQVSTDGGITFTNVVDGGVYAGATTSMLSITGATVGMSGYRYQNVVSVVSCSPSATSTAAGLTVNPLPATLSLSVAPYTKLYPGLTTVITATSTPAGASSVYQWFKNGVQVAATTTNTLSVDVDGLGTYTAKVTDGLGCSSALSGSLDILDSASTKLFIYPSPTTTGQFQVRYYSAPGNILARIVNIYDAKGTRQSSATYQVSKTYGQVDINMVNAAKGVYWVELADSNGKRIGVGRVIVL